MHARVVTTQMKPEAFDDAVRIYQESVVPAAQAQKGFKHIWLLSDRSTGKSYSIAVWETEADMAAGEASGYLKEQLGKFSGLFTAPPVTEHFEVAAEG